MSKHPALTFLQTLDPRPEATFNIEHYTDLPKGEEKPKLDPLAWRYPNLSISEVEVLIPKLHSINDRGAGIFVARNQCTGQRSKDTVSHVRGVHADMDGVSAAQLDSLKALLRPSIVVQSSSPDRNQLYWQLCEGEFLSHDETEGINRRLVISHYADKAAVDVSRLLRLPGFKHMKYRSEGKTPTVTITYEGCTYSADAIRQAFPPVQNYSPHLGYSQRVGDFCESTFPESSIAQSKLEALNKSIAARYPELWNGNWTTAVRSSGEVGYPSQSEADLALAGHIAGRQII
jgi:hypothetical protein